MSLHLVVGPAGARKVGALLDAHERASRQGREAWLVVPTGADVEPFQRELAGLQAPPGQPLRTPTPFGQVMPFRALEQQLLGRLGAGEQLLSPDHRHAVALAAIRGVVLEALGPAARSGWLAKELIALAEELSTTGDLAGSAEEGLRDWSARTSDARGKELADLLKADTHLLARIARDQALRQVDRAEAARMVAAALRESPSALGDLHLALSGFDDLDPVQRALVLAVGRSEAEVVLSLPFQVGREALAAAGQLVQILSDAGARTQALAVEPGRGPDAILARVEEHLYEQIVFQADAAAPEAESIGGHGAGLVDVRDAFGRPVIDDDAAALLGPLVPESAVFPDEPTPVETADAEAGAGSGEAPAAPRADAAAGESGVADAPVIELRGGGPDEEAALIAEHLRRLIEAGRAPETIAVAVGDPARQGPALLAALKRSGLPCHLVEQTALAKWPSVAALMSLMKAAEVGAEAKHLVGWLAGPGGPGGADALDAAVRRRGAASAREALVVWRSLGHGELAEFTAVSRAQRQDAPPGAIEEAVAGALKTRLEAALTLPGARSPSGERDLRAAAQVLRLIEGSRDGLTQLAQHVPELALGLDQLRELIENTGAPAEPEPAGSVAIVGPLGIRTRYLAVVVIARAQRGTYPGAEPVRRVLTPSDRARLTDFGWPAPVRPDHAASERYLAYEVVARPTAQLVLSWHDGDGDGKPCEPSPLLAEVRRAAGGQVPVVTMPSGAAARHALGDDRRARIQAARLGARYREPSPEQSALLAAQDRDRYAVGALQTASRCAAQWFVDHHLRPRPLSPDAAPLTAGRLRHELLADVVRAVVTGGESLRPEALGSLQAELGAAAGRLVERAGKRGETLAERLMRERVVAEIEATLPALCGYDVLGHQPEEFELAFGTLPRGASAADVPEGGADGDAAEGTDDLRPPITIERAGERLVLAGRIDRLDLSPDHRELVVVDYKGANVDQYRGQGWVEARELQAGLYALAAEQLIGSGSHAIASLYQPVPGPLGQPARGAAADALPGRVPLSRHDKLEAADWDELLDQLVILAAEAQRLIDDGIIAPDPTRCSAGGCRYPWLCREVQA